jgi:hypothetical protein
MLVFKMPATQEQKQCSFWLHKPGRSHMHVLPEPALSWAADWDYGLGGKSLAESSVNSSFLFLENGVTEVAVLLNEQELNLSSFT